MAITNINELEFIGESLPKINGNFSDLDLRVNTLQSVTDDYTQNKDFLSTHSNNSDILFSTGSLELQYTNTSYLKNNVYSTAGVSDLTKIIYPTTVYLNIFNTSETADVTYTIKVKETESSTLKNLMNQVKVSRATGSTIDLESRSMITFNDLGYYDWQIIVTGTSAKSQLFYTVKYLN